MSEERLDHIERRVARDRAALTQSLDALANTFAPERMSQTAEGYAVEIGQQVWGEAKKNPAAFALVGAGLALLMSGAGSRDRVASPTPAADPVDAMDGFDARVAAADAQIRQDATGERRPKVSSRRLRAAVNSGLERLNPETRARVLKLRHQAIATQMEIESRAERTARKAGAAYGRQPLAFGAAAFGIGALIASALPSSRREDELLGAHRDRLMGAASDMLQSELAALRATDATAPTAPAATSADASHVTGNAYARH
ncbi:hypothetical protein [Dinoroseobacter sp. S124A]|uniref:hypothetical protein n=1 Tax=Dinoroseobacter sp. S124A TaxID=3415128 RepID=UPI003C7DC03E